MSEIVFTDADGNEWRQPLTDVTAQHVDFIVAYDSATTGLPYIGALPRWQWRIPLVGRWLESRDNRRARAAADLVITWNAQGADDDD